MPGPPAARTQTSSGELEPWVARHLAASADLLGPEEEAVVVYVPPGLADRAALSQWAASRHLALDFAAPEPDEEDQGELVRLRLADDG